MSEMQNNRAKSRKQPGAGEQPLPPSNPEPGWKTLNRLLPKDMVITIDGPARTGKNTAGELLALALGGVVVDSGRFYRSLTQAALLAGINLDDQNAVASFCAGVRLDAIVRADDRSIYEALVTVDGALFTKPTLDSVGALTPKVAGIPLVRALVNAVLRRICELGRVIVLGRDMGAVVFPTTPYKFFFTAPRAIREVRDSGTSENQAVARRDEFDAPRTLIPENAAIIDTGAKSPEQVLIDILNEVVTRASG